MTESEKRILYLLERFENDQASPEELRELDRWYASFDDAPKLTDQISASESDQMHRRMLHKIEGELSASNDKKFRKGTGRMMGIGILAILVIGIILIFWEPRMQKVAGLEFDVASGKNKARLLISEHQAIDLEKAPIGVIYTAPGIAIRKDSAGLLSYRCDKSASSNSITNELIIPAGGTFRVVLSDGSKIWINANSKLNFPIGFSGNERKVQLNGEAYFEVAKNKAKPFIVQTPQQRIQVLGTHFNVNAYTDERIQKTTLLEGLVQISTSESVSKTVIIQPGQQADQDHNMIQVRSVNTEDAVGWKNGLFVFDQTELHDLMLQLSRWYNVDIVYQGNFPRRVFSGEIPRSYSLAEVLKVLELGSIHFRIEKATHTGSLKKLIIIP